METKFWNRNDKRILNFYLCNKIIQALQESWSMLMASFEISGDLIHSDDTVVRTKKKI